MLWHVLMLTCSDALAPVLMLTLMLWPVLMPTVMLWPVHMLTVMLWFYWLPAMLTVMLTVMLWLVMLPVMLTLVLLASAHARASSAVSISLAALFWQIPEAKRIPAQTKGIPEESGPCVSHEVSAHIPTAACCCMLCCNLGHAGGTGRKRQNAG